MKRKIITFLVFCLMWGIASIYTDGVIDSRQDLIALLYPLGIVWLWIRIVGIL